MVEFGSDHVGLGEPSGDPLRSSIARRRDEVGLLLAQIGHALVAAHEAGVGHGALSADHVFVSREGGEPFARVFGFDVVIEDYRHVRDDVAGLSALATELVDSSPPDGFAAWRARCATERLTMSECVSGLRALFPLAGERSGEPTGEHGRARRFEPAVSRSDRRAVRAKPFDRLGLGIAPIAFGTFAIAAALAFVVVRRARTNAAPVTPSPAVASVPSPSTSAGSFPLQATIDALAHDRAGCPDRLLEAPLVASKERSYRCVRAVLLPRVLETGAGGLSEEERRALKLACAALADLGCELRLTP